MFQRICPHWREDKYGNPVAELMMKKMLDDFQRSGKDLMAGENVHDGDDNDDEE
jgi:hypothetical protein